MGDAGDQKREEEERKQMIVYYSQDQEPSKVCELCGSRQNQDTMVNCTQCNASRHRYCLEVAEFDITGEWCCYECKKNANDATNPIKESSLLSLPAAHNWPALVVRSKRTPKKMKCISTSRHVHLPCPPSMKGISPSSQALPTYPPTMKCTTSSRQVHAASPPSMKFISPSSQIEVEDMKKRKKVQSGATNPMITYSRKGKVKRSDLHLQDQLKEGNVASVADKGKCNSWVGDQPTGKMTLNALVPTYADIGCGSRTRSLHNNIDIPVSISPSAEYVRRPPPEAICWKGCFLLSDGESFNLDEFEAYLPSVVSSKVYNIAKKMPNNIQLKIRPQMNYWPNTFEKISPVYDDIALLFFSTEFNCFYEKNPHLLKMQNSFVMKAYIDDMMLLIYSSELLPPDSQRIDGLSYLWGVFVKPKAKSNPTPLGSVAT